MLTKEKNQMRDFFTSDRNKVFIGGIVSLVLTVYVKDRFPLSEEQLKWITDGAIYLGSAWLVSRGIRKPEVAS
jgi:hypothetical protein